MYGTSVEFKVATIFYRKERASFPSEPKVLMYINYHLSDPRLKDQWKQTKKYLETKI